MLAQNTAFSQEQNIYFVAYMNRLQSKVKSNWILPHGNPDKKTVVTFVINRNGKIANSYLSESSKDKEFDNLALSAITHSVPFETFPAQIQNEKITVNLTFRQNDVEATPNLNEISFAPDSEIKNITPINKNDDTGIINACTTTNIDSTSNKTKTLNVVMTKIISIPERIYTTQKNNPNFPTPAIRNWALEQSSRYSYLISKTPSTENGQKLNSFLTIFDLK